MRSFNTTGPVKPDKHYCIVFVKPWMPDAMIHRRGRGLPVSALKLWYDVWVDVLAGRYLSRYAAAAAPASIAAGREADDVPDTPHPLSRRAGTRPAPKVTSVFQMIRCGRLSHGRGPPGGQRVGQVRGPGVASQIEQGPPVLDPVGILGIEHASQLPGRATCPHQGDAHTIWRRYSGA